MKQAEGGGIAVINGIRIYGNPKLGFSLSLSLCRSMQSKLGEGTLCNGLAFSLLFLY